MHPHLIKLLSLSALTVGILAASNAARADEATNEGGKAKCEQITEEQYRKEYSK